jgi:hypothetical protein
MTRTECSGGPSNSAVDVLHRIYGGIDEGLGRTHSVCPEPARAHQDLG